MKAMAGRELDEDDLRVLYVLCDFPSADAALDLIGQSYPRQSIKANAQYLVEGIAADATPRMD